MHNPQQQYHSLTDLPKFSKIWWVPFVSAFAMYCFKKQLINVFVPFIKIYCKDQDDMEKVNDRAIRAGAGLHKFIFYTGSAVGGYLILKDTPILPPGLGGSGSIDQIFVNMPYDKQYPYFLEYSLISMGYIIEDTVYHLCFKERTSDFWEMNLHHMCTLMLYGGMILQNFIPVGMVISWLHSLADVWSSLSRVLSQTTFKYSTVVSFGLCILTWAWTRNYWMPTLTRASIAHVIYPSELQQYQTAPNILNGCLVSLCILHYYWLVLFLNMYIKGIMKGDTDDKQRGVIENEKSADVIVNEKLTKVD